MPKTLTKRHLHHLKPRSPDLGDLMEGLSVIVPQILVVHVLSTRRNRDLNFLDHCCMGCEELVLHPVTRIVEDSGDESCRVIVDPQRLGADLFASAKELTPRVCE